MLTSLLQWIIDAGSAICGGLVYLLPTSPFTSLNGLTIGNDLLGAIAWFVPFPQMIALLEAWGLAVLSYYVWMLLLRWIKLVE